MTKKYKVKDAWKVGDIVKPASGGPSRRRITKISDDYIWHSNLDGSDETRKDRFGFFCRYCREDEVLESEKNIFDDPKKHMSVEQGSEGSFFQSPEDVMSAFMLDSGTEVFKYTEGTLSEDSEEDDGILSSIL